VTLQAAQMVRISEAKRSPAFSASQEAVTHLDIQQHGEEAESTAHSTKQA
jgi:hypothetical protein